MDVLNIWMESGLIYPPFTTFVRWNMRVKGANHLCSHLHLSVVWVTISLSSFGPEIQLSSISFSSILINEMAYCNTTHFDWLCLYVQGWHPLLSICGQQSTVVFEVSSIVGTLAAVQLVKYVESAVQTVSERELSDWMIGLQITDFIHSLLFLLTFWFYLLFHFFPRLTKQVESKVRL